MIMRFREITIQFGSMSRIIMSRPLRTTRKRGARAGDVSDSYNDSAGVETTVSADLGAAITIYGNGACHASQCHGAYPVAATSLVGQCCVPASCLILSTAIVRHICRSRERHSGKVTQDLYLKRSPPLLERFLLHRHVILPVRTISW